MHTPIDTPTPLLCFPACFCPYSRNLAENRGKRGRRHGRWLGETTHNRRAGCQDGRVEAAAPFHLQERSQGESTIVQQHSDIFLSTRTRIIRTSGTLRAVYTAGARRRGTRSGSSSVYGCPVSGTSARSRGRCTQYVHSRSCMTIYPSIPTMPGRSTSGFYQPGRHCLHQARSAVRCS